MLSKCGFERAAQARRVEHSEEEQSAVDSDSDFERAAQVFCRHRADRTVLSKRFASTEPIVNYFRSVLEAQSRQYGVFEACCRH